MADPARRNNCARNYSLRSKKAAPQAVFLLFLSPCDNSLCRIVGIKVLDNIGITAYYAKAIAEVV